MPPTHCPACKNPVPPHAQGCSFCPMSFDVDEKQAPSLVATESQNQMILVAALAAACLLVAGFWFRFGGGRSQEPVKAVVEDPPPPPKPVLEVRRYDPPAENEPAGEAAGASSPGPEEDAPAEWRMRGKIYDLISLNPIPVCMIVFIHPHTSARYETSTANDGSYKTLVPALAKGGYAVAFSHPAYHTSYWMASHDKASALSRAKRRQEALRLVGIVNVPVELAAEGKQPVQSEFFLIPKKLPAE